jgi:hypothetical protein
MQHYYEEGKCDGFWQGLVGGGYRTLGVEFSQFRSVWQLDRSFVHLVPFRSIPYRRQAP